MSDNDPENSALDLLITSQLKPWSSNAWKFGKSYALKLFDLCVLHDSSTNVLSGFCLFSWLIKYINMRSISILYVLSLCVCILLFLIWSLFWSVPKYSYAYIYIYIYMYTINTIYTCMFHNMSGQRREQAEETKSFSGSLSTATQAYMIWTCRIQYWTKTTRRISFSSLSFEQRVRAPSIFASSNAPDCSNSPAWTPSSYPAWLLRRQSLNLFL